MYKLSVFIPLDHLENIKLALFNAGAGKYQHYDQCCFVTIGRGQFRALSGAKPYIGEISKVEYIDEAKVEMICDSDREGIIRILHALKEAHPYEEPAYELIDLVDLPLPERQ